MNEGHAPINLLSSKHICHPPSPIVIMFIDKISITTTLTCCSTTRIGSSAGHGQENRGNWILCTTNGRLLIVPLLLCWCHGWLAGSHSVLAIICISSGWIVGVSYPLMFVYSDLISSPIEISNDSHSGWLHMHMCWSVGWLLIGWGCLWSSRPSTCMAGGKGGVTRVNRGQYRTHVHSRGEGNLLLHCPIKHTNTEGLCSSEEAVRLPFRPRHSDIFSQFSFVPTSDQLCDGPWDRKWLSIGGL